MAIICRIGHRSVANGVGKIIEPVGLIMSRLSAIAAIRTRQAYFVEDCARELEAWREARDAVIGKPGWRRWADDSVERARWEAYEKAAFELAVCVSALKRLEAASQPRGVR